MTFLGKIMTGLLIVLHIHSYSQSPPRHTDLPPGIQHEIDSLKDLVAKMPPGPDKSKMYGNICWAYATTRTHLHLARQYADSMRIAAEKLNDESKVAFSHFYYGIVDRFEGNFTSGLQHLHQFIDWYAQHGDSVRVASGLFQVGVITSNMGDYETSLPAFHRAIAIWQQKGDHYQVASTLNSIGIILKNMKRYDDAIEKYERAVVIFDSLGEDDRGYMRTNLGNLYAEINDFEKAAAYYRQAVDINYEINNMVEVAASLQNIGNMHNKLGRHDSALIYHLRSHELFSNWRQQTELAESMHKVGYSYLMLGRYKLAETNLRESLAIAKEAKAKPTIRDIYEDLSTLYARQKDFTQAYQYHQLYAGLKDSILNETTAKQLNELQTKYETGEKDKQILLLANEKQLNEKETQRQSTLKKVLIGGLLALALLIVLIMQIFRQRLKNQKLLSVKNEEIKEANFRQQMSELEMKALRAQINPHFLFNCMNSINRMILKGETENASIYLGKFSKLVRLILENAETPTVSLDSELALLESYIQLEGLRFKGKINYSISVDDGIDAAGTYLPSMVLQPFVENAIWHGLMHKEDNEKGKIVIHVSEEEDGLRCIIEDNGVGRTRAQELRENSIMQRQSMGMKITEDRLKLLDRENEEEVIRIIDLKDDHDRAAGTRIEVMIRFNNN